MSGEPTSSHGVMEGEGAYNRFAKLPAGGAAFALPLLEKAVERVAIEPGELPVVIADYGSSQGKNSMVPMQVAIRAFRTRLGPKRPIFVFHEDQPRNDFSSLFEVLATDPDSYALREPNVFPCVIGKSFYESVLPPDYVHLGWSSYAAVWLTCVPALIPGHFFAPRSAGAARAEFERQAARDWEAFLTLRARELRPGGRLVVVLPGVNDDGLSGFEGLMDHANEVLAEMVDRGEITAEERSRMVLASYPRRKGELLAPFSKDGQFRKLAVEACDMFVLPDAAWVDYQRDGDKEALATKHALFFRSIFVPSLASALARDPEVLRAFADRLQERLIRRLASRPAAIQSFVQAIVVVKQSDT